MLRVIRWALPVVAALVLAVCFSVPRVKADDAKSSTVSFSVVNSDGDAEANAEIKIYNAADAPKAHSHAAGATTEPTPVADLTSKDDGKVSASLPLGDYVALASLKKHGHGKQAFTVKDGDNSVTITLKEHQKPGATTAPAHAN